MYIGCKVSFSPFTSPDKTQALNEPHIRAVDSCVVGSCGRYAGVSAAERPVTESRIGTRNIAILGQNIIFIFNSSLLPKLSTCTLQHNHLISLYYTAILNFLILSLSALIIYQEIQTRCIPVRIFTRKL